MSHFKDVKVFMETFGQETNSKFVEPSLADVKLRLELILEEFSELVVAVTSDSEKSRELVKTLKRASVQIGALSAADIQIDHVETADALTDIEYVTLGAGHTFGVNLDATFAEVQRANMSKLGEDGKPIYREDGKVEKGPLYVGPDIVKALVDAGCFPDQRASV